MSKYLILPLLAQLISASEWCLAGPSGLVLDPSCFKNGYPNVRQPQVVLQGSIAEKKKKEDISPWSSRRCLMTKSSNAQYCIFTRTQGEQGLSIFTTPERASRFLELPNFDTFFRHDGPREPAYQVRPVPNRGSGVVANRTIPRGEIIIMEKPVVMLHNDIYRPALFSDEMSERIQRIAVRDLPKGSKDRFMSLVGHFGDVHPVVDIYQTNSFQVSMFKKKMSGITFGTSYNILVPDISRFNHECRPNAVYHFDSVNLRHVVAAARTIEPDEEITVSYVPLIELQETRFKYLNESWGFECDCALCKARHTHPEVVAASNTRIKEIRELISKLGDKSSFSSYTAVTDTAERLIELYREEKLWGFMHEVYMLVAKEWNAIGNLDSMMKYANLAFETAFTDEEKAGATALLEKAYWSWRK